MKHKIYFISVLVVNAHYLKSKFRFNLCNDDTAVSLMVLFMVSRPHLRRRWHHYSVGLVSRYREHFDEIQWRDFTTATFTCQHILYIMLWKLQILGTYPKSEAIARFYPIFFVHLQTFNRSFVVNMWQHFVTSISLVNTYNGKKA